jgi:hypothetical protein
MIEGLKCVPVFEISLLLMDKIQLIGKKKPEKNKNL